MNNTLWLLLFAGAAYYLFTKKTTEDNNGGDGGDDDEIIVEKPNTDPGANQYNPNTEKADLGVRGYFRVGNISYAESQGSLDIYVKNKSNQTGYIISGVEASVFYNGMQVGFKYPQKKEDVNYVVDKSKEVMIRMGHTPVYFYGERQHLYDEIKAKGGAWWPVPGTDMGDIMTCDVRIWWKPRNGAGTGQEAYYIDQKCFVRYVDGNFYGD